MAKRPKPKDVGRTGKCIFCNRQHAVSGKNIITDEHFWPDWLRNVLRPTQNASEYKSSYHFVGPDGGVTDLSPPQKKRVGAPVHRITLHVVCELCNNRWMSHIQDQTKPLLMLFLSDWPSLSSEAQTKLATWATMFTMVVDFDDMRAQVIPYRQRRLLRVYQKPLAGWSIFAARASSFHWHTTITQWPMTTFGQTPDGAPVGEFNARTGQHEIKFKITTLVFGKLILQAVCSNSMESDEFIEGIPFDHSPNVRKLWPPAESVVSSPPVAIRPQQYEHFAGYIAADFQRRILNGTLGTTK